ncbi:MAG: efflux RND transporter permease subunit, partial [Amphiplicatus sp.]|nr:efflux RND transporter permease subunit [Amphiplicatus sp.]
RNQLIGMANQDPMFAGVRPNGLEDVAQLDLHIDYQRAEAMGLSQSTINSTIATAMGG